MIKLKTTEQIKREVGKKQAEKQKEEELLKKKKRREEENEKKAKKKKVEKNKDDLQLETDKNLIPQIEKNLGVYLRMHKKKQTFTQQELQTALGLKKPIEIKALENIISNSEAISREKSGYGLSLNGGISSKTIAFIIVLLLFIAIFLVAR